MTPSLQNVVLRLKLKPEELKLLKQAVADWKWSAFDAHQRMAARCKMNDGREPTKETMDMAWNAYKMAEDIGDRIADATSPQNPGVHPSPDLIQPCIRAGCPAGGTVLDPFGGSGTTGEVAASEGRKAILVELNPE